MEPRELAQHADEIVHEFEVIFFPRPTDTLVVSLVVEAYKHYLSAIQRHEDGARGFDFEKQAYEQLFRELPKLIATWTSGKETLDASDPKTQEELARGTQHFLRELERQSAPSEEASPDPSIPSSSEPEAPKPKADESPLPEKQEGDS